MHDYLSPVDSAWYRIDESKNTADIVALITFEEPLDVANVRRIVEERFARYPQFSCRVIDPGMGLPHWEAVENFDVKDHFSHHILAGGSQEELQDLVSEVLTTRLIRDRPLWHIHTVENVGGGGAIVAKIHHCLGDGFALVGVLLTLSDESPEPGQEVEERIQSEFGFKEVWEGLTRGAKTAIGIGELALLPFDTKSCLVEPLSGVRKAAWSEGIPLDRFKAIGKAYGCTVNDVLMGSLAGALREWMIAQADQPDSTTIHAIVPVNLRPVEEMGKELGNQFGLVFLDLPVSEPDPSKRIHAVHASMREIREGELTLSSVILLGALGLLPDTLEHLAADIFTRKGSLVVTNVPGPRKKIRLAGKHVKELMFWVPHAGLLGLGVSLLSYAGEVRIGVRSDTGVTSRPEEIVRAFEHAIHELENSLS